jgi:hypothetical protein
VVIGQEYSRDFQLALSTVAGIGDVTGERRSSRPPRPRCRRRHPGSDRDASSADRGALSLSLLLPGVAVDTTRPKRNATNVGAGVTTSATTYLVDGLSNSVNKSGEQRHDIPESAIREFSVHTTQLPAQYGQRVGGVVNIVTKSGTNDFRGDVFEFFRNQQMTRNDIFTQQQIDAGRADPRYKRNQYGFSVGGRSSRTSSTTSARSSGHVSTASSPCPRLRSSIRRWPGRSRGARSPTSSSSAATTR